MSSLFSLARIRSEPGAKLYLFQSGTTTPQNAYTDPDLQVAHAHPMVADAEGYFDPIYLDPSLPDYRYILTDGIDPDDDYTLENLLEPITDDYPASQNVSSAYRVKGASPEIIIEETDASANSKKWSIRANAGSLVIAAMDDAESTRTPLVTLNRTSVLQLVPLSSSGATLDISTLQVGHSAIIFTTGTARSNTATPTADPILQFTSAPAGTYRTEGYIKYTAETAGDFVLNWPRAGGVAKGTMHWAYGDGLGSSQGGVMPFSQVMEGVLTGVPFSIPVAVTVDGVETATAGQTLGPHWCQGTSDASATTILSGSWLKVTRLT
jgi:hypothetical protein